MERLVVAGSVPGLSLVGDVWGPVGGPGVLLMHGGGQTRHSWRATGERLGAAGYRVWSIDQRGHGESGWAADGDYSLDAFTADVRAICDQLDPHPALVGASLGGLASLLAVGCEPRIKASALVLVDIAPRSNRTGRDQIGAFMRSAPHGFASLDEAADAVAAYLPHRSRPVDPSGLLKNLRRRSDDRLYWHWDPAFLHGSLPEQASDRTRLERAALAVRAPILLVRGGNSEVVTPEDAAAFRALLPHAESVDVAGTGHMVAGDRNDSFTAAVAEFLARRVSVAG